MKFKCNKNDLLICLSSVTKTASTKTTMPILEGILIETIGDKVKFTTNDLELGSEYVINAEIEIEGKIVVDSKMFNEIIRKLESEHITFELKESIFIIKSASGIFKLSTMNAEDYPKLPVFNVDNSIIIKQSIFKEMIKKTIFATSQDENRPVYTGALVTVEENILKIVAIDGFRMALRQQLLDSSNNFKAIIPGKTLSELTKILSDDEEQTVKIGVNRNQALFEMGNCIVVSRIIEGEFLNYNSVIPNEFETKIKIKTKQLLESLDRVSLFSREVSEKEKKAPIKILINMEGIEVSCISQAGDAKENIVSVVEGKELEIGFNPRYLIEALKAIENDEIILQFTTNISPMIIKEVHGNDYIYMVLPVKLRQD
ncbi:MAG: DNA polymerase III subunit beta [Clostridia bacterium]|nr:DNA polymerase III subunit beta [Clostridia bacterium]